MNSKESLQISLEDIQEAAQNLKDAVIQTPLKESHHFSDRFGGKIFLKLENLQHTGSFKTRGALNKILSLSPQERKAGVIAASAGNHAQGVAYQASRLGIRAVIVMPKYSPIVKINATRDYGGEVVLSGETYDEAYEHALKLQKEQGFTFIHPFEDPKVIAGQGTIGSEILEQCPSVDQIIVPVGGGGLISGISLAVKGINQKVRVIGVQAEGAPSLVRSFKSGKAEALEKIQTIAEGIATKKASLRMLELIKKGVDEMVVVPEEAIAKAILLLMERGKLVVEGAGAVGMAALLANKISSKNLTTVVVISGGNIDFNIISLIIERGLMADGRLIKLVFVLEDRPGALHRLTSVLEKQSTNILEVYHNRLSPFVAMGKASVTLLLETRGHDHVQELKRALHAEGYELTEG